MTAVSSPTRWAEADRSRAGVPGRLQELRGDVRGQGQVPGQVRRGLAGVAVVAGQVQRQGGQGQDVRQGGQLGLEPGRFVAVRPHELRQAFHHGPAQQVGGIQERRVPAPVVQLVGQVGQRGGQHPGGVQQPPGPAGTVAEQLAERRHRRWIPAQAVLGRLLHPRGDVRRRFGVAGQP